jgi:ribonuclease HI
MKKATKTKRDPAQAKPLRIYTDGAGSRPDGKGSGFAWFREDTGDKHIERVDGLTNNEAEYRGLRSAVESLPKRTVVEILTDSQLMCSQFNGVYKIRDPKLQNLLQEIREVIAAKELRVTVAWVPRSINVSGKLL